MINNSYPSAWRAVVAAALLSTAAALATAAPAQAAEPAQTQQGQVYAWVSDGWGGGTLTSSPAGINCHQGAISGDPYAGGEQPNPTGTCSASFPVGTTVTFTATADPGSYVNIGPDPASLTVVSGYNSVWVMFCPQDGLCSS
ncbi:hypothetical protein GCM10022403_032680 [Streptomyces coacervatus]|uniref:Secreted protein n=1 Tax=Streptomyces coacervatus TaxID=647381 RepID=A0ABP7HS51_9ACTN|nr:hypothetical protein [Streptomyces coacervatus]MDF2272395.1 hypothetical protein [Streptomyces coacervatus]